MPTRIVLTYLSGVSNWGPKTASGVAEIIAGEGEARLSAGGLPAVVGTHYILWLGREGTDDVFEIGETIVGPDGTGTVDLVLPDAIPNRGWNLAFITAEDRPNVDRPGTRRVLAGRFPKPLPQGTIPLGLPNTGVGGGAADSSLPALLAVLVPASGAVVLLRRKNKPVIGRVS